MARVRMPVFWKAFSSVGRWLFALFAIASWFTRHGGEAVHYGFGAAASVIVAIRIYGGFAGPDEARFTKIMRDAGAVLRPNASAQPEFAAALLACTLIAVLTATLLIAVTGWLLTTDALWSSHWFGTAHATLGIVLLTLLLIHSALTLAGRTPRHRI